MFSKSINFAESTQFPQVPKFQEFSKFPNSHQFHHISDFLSLSNFNKFHNSSFLHGAINFVNASVRDPDVQPSVVVSSHFKNNELDWKLQVLTIAFSSGWCRLVVCCADTSSDGDEHNEFLFLFSHATVAPALLSRLSALDELSVALTCRFSLDIFSVVQQDFPEALDDGTMPDLEMEDRA